MQRIALTLLVTALTGATAWGSHAQAVVGDAIDGDGNGSFSGTYTQSSTDHPWYTIDANAGDNLVYNATNNWPSGGAYLWLYRVLDDNAQVGDTPFGGTPDLTLVAQTYVGNSGILSYVAAATGQYIVQYDSWLGGGGNYQLNASGSTVPEPSSIVIMGGLLGFAGFAARRRRKKVAAA